jgi:hypothetical protein
MRNHFLRTITLPAVTSLLLSGCLLSSAVDRTYLGFNESNPTYQDRKMTGLALLPFAVALDVLFLPVEALVIIFEGDNFPEQSKGPREGSAPPKTNEQDRRSALENNSEFARLSDQQKAVALAEFDHLMRWGLPANSAQVLTADGHWVSVPLSAEARRSLLARAQFARLPEVALMSAE